MARGGCGCITGMGHALVQSLLAPGGIVSVIRCSVGARSECRVSRALAVPFLGNPDLVRLAVWISTTTALSSLY